jgi:hypothetical protein
METIYNSEILGGVEDKYSYWVYKEIQKQSIITSTGEEIK